MKELFGIKIRVYTLHWVWELVEPLER